MNPYGVALFAIPGILLSMVTYKYHAMPIAIINSLGFAIALLPTLENSRIGKVYKTAHESLGRENADHRGFTITMWLMLPIVIVGLVVWILFGRLLESATAIVSDMQTYETRLNDSIQLLVLQMREFATKYLPWVDFDAKVVEFQKNVLGYVADIAKGSFGFIAGGLLVGAHGLSIILVTMLATAYALLEWTLISEGARRIARKVMPNNEMQHALLVDEFQKNIRGFLRGIGKVGLTLAIVYSIILLCMGVRPDKALLLGILLGMCECIPKIGWTIALMILAPTSIIFFGFTTYAVVLLCIGVVIAMIDVNVITPRFLSKEVKAPSALIFLFIFSGVILFGAVSGIPLALILLSLTLALYTVYTAE